MEVQYTRRTNSQTTLQILHIEKAVHTSSVAAYGNKKGQYLKIYLSDTSDECNSAILTLYDHQLPLAGMLQKVRPKRTLISMTGF